jgi:hypothetical protein
LGVSLADTAYRPKCYFGVICGFGAFFWAGPDTASVVWPRKWIQAVAQNPQKPVFMAVREADGGESLSVPPPLADDKSPSRRRAIGNARVDPATPPPPLLPPASHGVRTRIYRAWGRLGWPRRKRARTRRKLEQAPQ